MRCAMLNGISRMIVVGVVLGLLTGSMANAQEAMTVDDAIRIGLENNFSIRIARNNAEAAGNNRGLGSAELLPKLDAAGGYTSADTKEDTNSPTSLGDRDTKTTTGSLTLSWTLFDGFKMFSERNRYRELAKLGETQARQTIETQVVAIAGAFFNFVQQEQLLDVARDSRDISAERLEKQRVRNEVGGASSTDLLNAQVSFNSDESDLLNRELEVTIARQNLNVLLGRDASEPVVVSKEISVQPMALSLDEVRKLAEGRNAALRVAEQDLKVAENKARGTWSPFVPKVALNAGYGYTDRTTSPNGTDDITAETNEGSIGLNLTFNLFNGGRDKIARQNALIEQRNKQLALKEAQLRLAGNIQQAWDRFQQRLRLVELEEQNVRAAEQNLQLQQDRFLLGATTSLDFRDAQVSLNRSRTALIVARFQARISRLELEQLTGSLVIE